METLLRDTGCQSKDDGVLPVSLHRCFSSSPSSWPSVLLTAVWADARGGNSILDYTGRVTSVASHGLTDGKPLSKVEMKFTSDSDFLGANKTDF